MTNRKSSVDGFIPRRTASELGERHEIRRTLNTPVRKELRGENDLTSDDAIGRPRPGKTLGRADVSGRADAIERADIDDSLNNLDTPDEIPGKKLSRKERRRLKKERRTRGQRIRRRIIIIAVTLIIVAGLAIGGFLAYKAFRATGNVLNGNFFDIVQHEPLKEDANGRSNFLLLGTSEDDPGHEAGYLTDSIMILSIDQTNKNAYTYSIPRDLYVDYGTACLTGYRGKINVYFSCVNDGTDAAAEQDRLTKTRKFIGNIVGMDIQYAVHVNYTVMRDVVKAIGNKITVKIESRDPRGVMDSNFNWKCGATYYERIQKCPPDGNYIQYPNGEVTLDAEHALYLAQARGDIAPTYGFEQSNFDRERNQQKILVAIRDKALSAGTLTNLGAVTGLIDALGNNLRTNIETKEIRTLMQLGQDIKSEDIQSIDLYSTDNPIFTTGPIAGAGSSVYPKAGIYNYTDLRAFLKKKLSSNPVVREGANVTVLNGSDTSGLAQEVADKLTAAGFTIDEVGNAPTSGKYAAIEIYQLNDKMTATAAKLKALYNVEIKTTKPPISVTGNTDFLIIVGSASVVGDGTSSTTSN